MKLMFDGIEHKYLPQKTKSLHGDFLISSFTGPCFILLNFDRENLLDTRVDYPTEKRVIPGIVGGKRFENLLTRICSIFGQSVFTGKVRPTSIRQVNVVNTLPDPIFPCKTPSKPGTAYIVPNI